MEKIEIFTDGACSGNPGPGGYGAILRYKGTSKELWGGDPSTTNNRMELTAVITALSALKEPCEVERLKVYNRRCYKRLGKKMACKQLGEIGQEKGSKQ